MADSSGGFQPIGNDPGLSDARLRAINQVVAPDTQPPESEHPAVTFAKNLLSPMGPYGGMPQDFNPYAAPADQRGAAQDVPQNIGGFLGNLGGALTNPEYGLGATAGAVAQGFVPFTKSLFGIRSADTPGFLRDEGAYPKPGEADYLENPAAALGPEAVLGGKLAGYISPVAGELAGQAVRNIAGRAVSGAAELARGGLPQFATEAAGEGRADLGMGGPLVQRIAARQAELHPSAAANEALAAAKGAEFQPGTGAALKPSEVPAETGPRYTAEQVPNSSRFTVVDATTGKAEPLNFSTREAAQAKADQFNVPTPANPFAVPQEASLKAALTYVTKAPTADPALSVGDVVRRAARANPETVTPEFLAQQPETRQAINDGLAKAKLLLSDENATAVAQQLLGQEAIRPTVGNKNAALVEEALKGGPKPSGELPSIFPEPSGDLRTAGGGKPPQGPNEPIATSGGQMPPDQPLPFGTTAPRSLASALTEGTMTAISDLPRAAILIGHLPLVRQAAPLLADAVLRQNPVAAVRTIGRMLADTAGSLASERTFNSILDGQRSLIAEAGIQPGLRYRGAADLLSPIHGPLNATEEYGLRSLFGQTLSVGPEIPALGGRRLNLNLAANVNRIFPAMLNSLRTGAAIDLARMQKQSWGFVKSDDIVHTVRIISGKGDLPGGANTAKVLNGVFFGPRLMTSSWQYPAEVIGSMKTIGSDLLSKKPLNPSDVMKVRSLAGYVATGMGIMKIANAFGLELELNPDSRDFGRIILPDGSRVDIWGQFGPDARLVAQELNFFNQHVLQRRPISPLEDTGADMALNYFRSKLNAGVSSAVGNVLAGKTMAGVPVHAPQSAADVVEAVTNPANWPQPLAVQEAQTGGGGALGVAKAGLVAAGATVVNTPRHVNYDGLGVAEGQPNYRSGSILDTYAKIAQASQGSATPWHGGDPIMPPPPTTIGSGRTELKLDAVTAVRFTQAIGDARDRALGPLVNSPEFQNAGTTQQQRMFDDARQKADNLATRVFMRDELITATDSKAIAAEALTGFVAQGGSLHDRAYWIATLNRAGKLTSEATQAIDDYEKQLATAEKRAPITVQEYSRYAPLAHEYLAHVPFGSDTHPIGTPADWTAVAQAHEAKNVRVDELVRSGIRPSVADVRAQTEILQAMRSPVQRNLFLNGTQLENPQRRLLAIKYPTLNRFLGPVHQYTRESETEYQNFP